MERALPLPFFFNFKLEAPKSGNREKPQCGNAPLAPPIDRGNNRVSPHRRMQMEETWTANDISKGNYIGVLEFEENGEWHNFEIIELKDRIVFGGACNVGFLESGYMLKEEYENTLEELLEELKAFYRDGKQYAPRIVCNERM